MLGAALLLLKNLTVSPSGFFEVTLIGLTTGCVYALVALGYTLVYGILELINFAHGDVFMLGGMFTITISTHLFNLHTGQGFAIVPIVFGTLLLAMLACGVLNATIEFIAYRPLRSAPRLAPLITAIGVSFIIEDVGLFFWGPNYVTAPDVFPHTKVFSFHGVDYGWNKLIVVAITIPVLLGLLYLVQQTRQGKAMRATAQDKDAAAIMGINVNRTISFTFMIAGCLAGSAGLLYALYFTNVTFLTGFRVGLIAFTAAVMGGIGNVRGAVLGGLIIGVIQSLTDSRMGPQWTEAVVFGYLIAIMVLRPRGLLGEETREAG